MVVQMGGGVTSKPQRELIELIRSAQAYSVTIRAWADFDAIGVADVLDGLVEQLEALRGIAADWLIGEHWASGRPGTTKDEALALIDAELANSSPAKDYELHVRTGATQTFAADDDDYPASEPKESA